MVLNKDYTIKDIVAGSLGQYPINGKYIFYKRVNKISKGVYKSLYDDTFIYKDNKVISVKNVDNNTTKSCSSGIHLSTPFYWNKGDTLIACEVKVKDIITCLEGKVRVRKCKVLGEIN